MYKKTAAPITTIRLGVSHTSRSCMSTSTGMRIDWICARGDKARGGSSSIARHLGHVTALLRDRHDWRQEATHDAHKKALLH